MNPPTDCPRCGQAAVTDPVCPRCGVIVAKAFDRRAVPRAPRPTAPLVVAEEPSSGMPGWSVAVMALGLGMAAFVGARLWQKSHRPTDAAPPAAAESTAPPAGSAEANAPQPSLAAPVYVPPEQLRVEGPQVTDADRTKFDELAQRQATPGAITAADVQAAEDLLSRHPDDRPVRNLLEAVLLNAATRHQQQRQFPSAVAYLQRAQQVQPTSIRPSLGLMEAALQTGDWKAMEAAARAVIAIDARHFDALTALGYALMRQDRNREAVEALNAALAIKEDATARSILRQIEKEMADERGMAERQVSHFNVRYDGEAHEGIGREVVRELEHHYATLAGQFDFEPSATIPVILFTQEQYSEAAGVPLWAAGNFDEKDGRIRLPVGGMTTSLSPWVDKVLLHELTHAFIDDRTRGAIPHDVAGLSLLHEGIAQYMSGDRTMEMPDPEQLEAIANGQLRSVHSVYVAALSFVEYLVALRGMGGLNEMLRVAGSTRNIDEAFRQVYGRDYRATKLAWYERLRQQHATN